MKSFTDLFIKRPVLAMVVSFVILIAGSKAVLPILFPQQLAGLGGLNVRQYPRSDIASISITTVYVGADAELVRGFITTPLERAIAAADGIDYIQSQSKQGQSVITARLKLNYDANKALSDISSKVDAIRRDLPPEAEIPVIEILSQDSQRASAYLSFTSDILQPNEVTDYLVRRRAADILRERAAGTDAASRRVETVNTRNHRADYERAVARIGKQVRAVVVTDKGAFTIELLAGEAPLNVDNFVELARRHYFDGVAFHRVVPNFVVQGGDPRGDGNGGPGYQIRDEINTVPYDRGAVGMALSGKDTGGSQWFVTHSPQPHLDGGYTVFGRVVEGMDVVDRIARGDRIRSVTITETNAGRAAAGRGQR